MRIVYMGTPDFAVNPLHALAEAGYEVVGVVTQPDKPKGRGKTMLPTPVKEEAMKHGFPVFQPVKVTGSGISGGSGGTGAGYYCGSSIRTDHSEEHSGTAKVRMHQHPCLPASQIPRCSANPAGGD